MNQQKYFGNRLKSQERISETNLLTRKSIKSLLGLDQGIFGEMIES